MIAWDDFRLVKAVADTRSLAGAAAKLAVNTSTVFRRLGALETRLGARLFERGRAGYALTPAGEEMVNLAGRMSDEVIAFERRISGQDLKPSGELRLTTNDTLIMHGLTPVLAKFRRTYPDIHLDVIIGNPPLNLSIRDADVALRATNSPPETLVGRRVATLNWAIYGNLETPESEDLEQLRASDWVGPGEELMNIGPSRFIRDVIGDDRVVYRLNTLLGLAEAIVAGIGIGPLPRFIGDRTPGLKVVHVPQGIPSAALWLLTHPDLRTSARVRAFLDVVGSELIRMRPLFEGVQPAAEAQPAA